VPARTGAAHARRLFVTCLVDAVRPEIGFGAEAARERRLHGRGAGDADLLRPARLQLRRQRRRRGRWPRRCSREFEGFDYVVVPSGSCGGQIKVHYVELFKDDPDLKARAERSRRAPTS
jgi:L-lactate dehydrogenase complex protein LldE